MYEDIKTIISEKNPNLGNESLTYFTNYFYILVKFC